MATHWLWVRIAFLLIVMASRALSIPIDDAIVKAAKSVRAMDFLLEGRDDVVNLELDMMISLDQWQRMNGDSNVRRTSREATETIALWIDGVIPYEIDSSFNTDDIIEIHTAFNAWVSFTCLTFRPTTPLDDHKVLIASGDGCKSYVGQHTEPQYLYLAEDCRKANIISHELGHTLGLFHTQSRPDRDQHVTIVWDNVATPMHAQFHIHASQAVIELEVPYDYHSVMHYGSKAFSINERYTIVTRDTNFQGVIGNRLTPSFRDLKTINLLYGCGASCTGSCPGEGFHSKDCECLCPGDPVQPCHLGGTEPDAGGKLNDNDVIAEPEQAQEKDCHDKNSQCGDWSSQGKCNDNPDYMLKFCPDACGQCGCEDKNSKCPKWAKAGACTSAPVFMEVYCKAVCSFCGGDGPVDSQCRDYSDSCTRWREMGHCGIASPYRPYMSTNCPKACQLCHEKAQAPDAPHRQPQTPTTCKDLDPNCVTFAGSGECQENEAYMLLFCPKACERC